MAEKLFTFLCYGSSLTHVKEGNTTSGKVKKTKNNTKKYETLKRKEMDKPGIGS